MGVRLESGDPDPIRIAGRGRPRPTRPTSRQLSFGPRLGPPIDQLTTSYDVISSSSVMAGPSRTCAGLGGLLRSRAGVGRPSTPPTIIGRTTSHTTSGLLSRLSPTAQNDRIKSLLPSLASPRLTPWAATCRGYRSRAEPPPLDRADPPAKLHSTEQSAAQATTPPASLSGTPQTSPAQPDPQPSVPSPPKVDAATDVSRTDDVSEKEQTRRDWEIIRTLIPNIWPKDDWKTKTRVLTAVGLLVGGKVSSALVAG